MKNSKTTEFVKRPNIVLALTAGFIVCYFFAAVTVCRNSNFVEGIQQTHVTNDFVRSAIRNSLLHDANFFRNAAEKLQFSRHDIELVGLAFRLAAIKGPADYKNLLSYGIYAASTPYGREQAPLLLQEAVRREQSDPKIRVTASSYLLKIGRKEEAFSYLTRAMELDASVAWDAYPMIQKYGSTTEDLIRITPRNIDSRFILLSVLAHRKSTPAEVTLRLVNDLARMPLAPEQRIQVARNALKLDRLDLAREQAASVLEDPEVRIEALKILADISLSQKNWKEFDEFSSKIEITYKNRGAKEEAARYALETATRLAAAEGIQRAQQRLQRIMSEYPQFVPAYIKAGSMYEKAGDFSSARKQYEKALAVDPQNADAREALLRIPDR